MTEPELPALLGSTAEAIVNNAKDLGLTWTLRPATASTPTTDGPTVVYDGDTTVMNAVSLIGTVSGTERVMMLQIPPGGNYIIGLLAERPPLGLANVSTAGTIATATSASEVAISSANWASEPIFTFPPGRIFSVQMTGGCYNTAGGPRIIGVRLRVGQSTISGNLLVYRPWLCDLIAGVGASYDWTGYFKNSSTSTLNSRLSVTIQNILGTGTVAIYGDATQPNVVTVQDYCAIADAPGLAAVSNSVL